MSSYPWIDLYLQQHPLSTDDSINLKNRLAEAIQLSNEINTLLGNYTHAEKMLFWLINYCQQNSLEIRMADNQCEMARLMLEKGEYGKANSWLDLAEVIYKRFDILPGLKNILNIRGNIFLYTNQYEKSMTCYKDALHVLKDAENPLFYARITQNLGLVYKNLKNFDLAKQNFEEALAAFKKLNDKSNEARALGNLGILHVNLFNYEKALDLYHQALSIYQEIGEKASSSRLIVNMGIVYRNLGDLTSAMDQYIKVLPILMELSDARGICLVNGVMGDIYHQLDEPEKAIDHYDVSINSARRLNLKKYLCNFIYQKALLLFEVNQWEEAKFLNDEALELATFLKNADDAYCCRCLQAKIKSVTNPETALEELLALISDDVEKEDLADLHYYVWKVMYRLKKDTINLEFYRQKALQLYINLNPNKTNRRLNKKISELNI